MLACGAFFGGGGFWIVTIKKKLKSKNLEFAMPTTIQDLFYQTGLRREGSVRWGSQVSVFQSGCESGDSGILLGVCEAGM